MRVHHLNCGTMRPAVVGRLVCHVLLCETADGLVLIDSGLGLQDLANPAARLGPARHLLKPAYDPAETAVRQVEALGFAAEDVRHILATHFDLDHIGGIADFPWAVVHTTAVEHAAATAPATLNERRRYHAAQWSHGPTVRTYDGGGEPWRDFAAAYPLEGLDERFALVPLPGHTRGHAAVAVDTGDGGWLLHAGDAFFDRSSVAGPHSSATDRRPNRMLRAFEQVVAFDRPAVRHNHERLAELDARLESGIRVICAHDPVLYDRLAAAPAR